MPPKDDDLRDLREEIQRSEDKIANRLDKLEAKLDRLVEKVLGELTETTARSRLNNKLLIGLIGGGATAAGVASQLFGG